MYFKNRKLLYTKSGLLSLVHVEHSKLVKLFVSFKNCQQQTSNYIATHGTYINLINSELPTKWKTIIIWKICFLQYSWGFWVKPKFFDLGNKPGLPEQQQMFLSCLPRWEPEDQPPQVCACQSTQPGEQTGVTEAPQPVRKLWYHRTNWNMVGQLTWLEDHDGWHPHLQRRA